MKKLIMLVLVLLGSIGFAACTNDDGGAADPDGGSDGDTDSDTDTDSDSDPVEMYDFEANAPWYLCDEAPYPDGTTVVQAFVDEHQYITFGDAGVDRREIEAAVEFPDAGNWAQVGMKFHLECPEGLACDSWDRVGSVQLIENPGGADETAVEIFRHVTPYKIEMCQYIDVTPLAGKLVGQQTLRSYIDTWVGPGHTDGAGWQVSVEFVFYPGPKADADETINIWSRRSVTVGEIEPDVNVDSQIDPVDFEIPADATKVEAHLFSTGHSFGNTSNCAEFCQMRKDIIINGTIHSVNNWRSDCPENPVSPQYGTWQYARNGWCPGSIVVGNVVDITDAVTIGGSNTLDFDILLANGTQYDNASPVDLLPTELISLKIYVYK